MCVYIYIYIYIYIQENYIFYIKWFIAIHWRNNFITNNIITRNKLSFQKKNKWMKMIFSTI